MESLCGVYRIKCLSNGYFYVGSSVDIYKRQARHFYDLERGRHPNVFLQRVYNKYGLETFAVSIKCTANEAQARALELRFLKKYRTNSRCMNIGLHACGGDNISKHPNKKYIRVKIATSLRKTLANLTQIEKMSKYGRHGKSNGMFGKTHTDKARRKISEANLGVSRNAGLAKSDQAKKNMASAAKLRASEATYVNPFSGKQHTKKTLRLLSTINKGRQPPNTRKVQVGKKRFVSLTAAARFLSVVPATVLNRIRSSNYPDYKYLD